MITYVRGDLFSSPAQVLVNTVNTVGVMGKGVAKEFKAIYPEMFREYQALCERGELTIGSLFLFRTSHKWILNFPTKKHWRQRSKAEFIEAGLRTFVEHHADMAIESIAFPQLGCGNGELDWDRQVRPLMEEYLSALRIDVTVYLYANQSGVPEHRDVERTRAWLRSQPHYLSVDEVWSDLLAVIEREELPDPWQVDRVPSECDSEYLVLPRYLGHDRFVGRDDVLQIWQLLRSYGYVNARQLPVHLAEISGPLFDLLACLSFIEKTSTVTVLGRASSGVAIPSPMYHPEPRALRLISPAASREVAEARPEQLAFDERSDAWLQEALIPA
jgi:O-acetyl-ADP-ribose deacetylase (regulator of RNase III)